MKPARLSVLGFLFTLALLATVSANAHSKGQTYLYLSISEQDIMVRFEVSPEDLNKALRLGLATDGSLSIADLQSHSQVIADYLTGRTTIAPDGKRADLRFEQHTIRDTEASQYVLSHFAIDDLPQRAERIDFDYNVLLDEDSKHSGVLVIENDWKSHTFANEAGVSLVFTNDSRKQSLDLTSSSYLRGLLGMVRLGMVHILEGYDHIMFLIALLLPAVLWRKDRHWEPVTRFRSALWQVAKIVTVFTIAHTITLSLAALQIVAMPPRLVESVIAASIAIAALDVFFPIFHKRIVLVVFLFGLFHGAGFASVILSMEIHPDYMVGTLFGFNLGVEVGQLIIVCLLFPVFFALRNWAGYVRYAMPMVAVCLIVVASYWFVERAFDVDLPAGEYAQRLLGMQPGD